MKPIDKVLPRSRHFAGQFRQRLNGRRISRGMLIQFSDTILVPEVYSAHPLTSRPESI